MPLPVHTPRVNNNDDTVRLSHIYASTGTKIKRGDPLIDIETDKATFTVEAENDGYLLSVCAGLGDTIAVGSVVAWIGSSPHERADAAPSQGPIDATRSGPTLKALLLLKQHGLRLTDVAPAGAQLTAQDVLRHVAGTGNGSAKAPAAERATSSMPLVPGRAVPLTPEQRAMSKTVCWQRAEAAASYLEIAYDPEPWRAYAAEFQKTNGLWYDPLLSLLSWRLVRIAHEYPRINGTMASGSAFLFDEVNLGFTVQAAATLYLVVVKHASTLDELEFARQLSALQVSAARHSLTPEQTSGATLAFSSMARWNVTRHMPVLPPQTALIVAHTAARNGEATLGATYDHRLLTGFEVMNALKALSSPPSLR